MVELALQRLIDPPSGTIGEYFGIDWRPARTQRVSIVAEAGSI
jgi:mannose/cellobiose epimerase-like protein (N-acyl-D-glucosamine 2-epimerase family)